MKKPSANYIQGVVYIKILIFFLYQNLWNVLKTLYTSMMFSKPICIFRCRERTPALIYFPINHSGSVIKTMIKNMHHCFAKIKSTVRIIFSLFIKNFIYLFFWRCLYIIIFLLHSFFSWKYRLSILKMMWDVTLSRDGG